MSRIYIANLASLTVSVEQVRPRRVLTVIDPGTPVPALPSVEPGNHLRLFFHDIVESAHPEAVLPGEEHVRRIVEFGADLAEPHAEGGLLVHCYAGVSRSTASAYILLCLHNPGREREAARLLRANAAHAIPNRRMVELADDLLARAGQMVEAVAAMPPPTAPAFAQLIELPVRLSEVASPET